MRQSCVVAIALTWLWPATGAALPVYVNVVHEIVDGDIATVNGASVTLVATQTGSVNNFGDYAIRARVDGGVTALLTYNSATGTLAAAGEGGPGGFIALQGEIAEGASPNTFSTDSWTNPFDRPTINDNLAVLARGYLTENLPNINDGNTDNDGPVDDSTLQNNRGIWRANNLSSDFANVFLDLDATPSVPGTFLELSLSGAPATSDKGTYTIFAAHYGSSPTLPHVQTGVAIFVDSGSGFAPEVQTGDILGGTGGANLQEIYGHGRNILENQGIFAFRGRDSTGRDGVWRHNSVTGVNALVTLQGATVVPIDGGTAIQGRVDLGAVAISPLRVIAYTSRLQAQPAGPGMPEINGSNNTALWTVAANGVFTLIAQEGSVAPGAGGATYGDLERGNLISPGLFTGPVKFDINAFGAVAFVAALSASPTDEGLFYRTRTGQTLLMARVGDTFEVDGVLRTIAGIDATTGAFLTNSGKMLVQFSFVDDGLGVRRGLFLLTVAEPQVMLLSLMGIVFLGFLGHRQGRRRHSNRNPARFAL